MTFPISVRRRSLVRSCLAGTTAVCLAAGAWSGPARAFEDVPAAARAASASQAGANPAETRKEPAAPAKEQPAAKSDEWIRLKRDAEGRPAAMEIATVRYVPAPGSKYASRRPADKPLVVELIGVVHIADRDYYEALSRGFEQYDSLLYEMVKPPGVEGVPRRRREEGGAGGLAFVQEKLLPGMLGLVPQLRHVDYSKKNFVHADLTTDELAKRMEDRGDTVGSVVLKVYGETLADLQKRAAAEKAEGKPPEKTTKPGPAETDLVTLLFTPEGALELKRRMAGAMSDLKNLTASETLFELIIRDRNEAAVKVLVDRIGKGDRFLGVFYGAGHMPDLDLRLTRDLGLQRTEIRWSTAWDLTKVPKQGGLPGLFRLLQETPASDEPAPPKKGPQP